MAVDLIGRLITELRADVGVTGVVGPRVWGAEKPSNAGPDPRPFIQVLKLTPVRMKHAPVQTVRVAVQSTAKTPRLAAQLAGLVSDALHMKGPRFTSGGIGIYQSVEELGGQPARDPQTRWPYETAVYTVVATTAAMA